MAAAEMAENIRTKNRTGCLLENIEILFYESRFNPAGWNKKSRIRSDLAPALFSGYISAVCLHQTVA